MSVTVVAGNMFEADVDCITDANNSIGISGAGLARIFKERYPKLSEIYNSSCQIMQAGYGNVILLPPMIYPKDQYDNHDFAVCKFPTMILPGSITKNEDIVQNLKHLKTFLTLDGSKIESIALPALGCGIGRYSFKQLEENVRKEFDDSPIRVSLYKPAG